jgi:hypothetical protein
MQVQVNIFGSCPFSLSVLRQESKICSCSPIELIYYMTCAPIFLASHNWRCWNGISLFKSLFCELSVTQGFKMFLKWKLDIFYAKGNLTTVTCFWGINLSYIIFFVCLIHIIHLLRRMELRAFIGSGKFGLEILKEWDHLQLLSIDRRIM